MKIFGFILVMFLIMPSSEDTQMTQTTNRRHNRGSVKNRLIKETFSNGNPDKCQIFKVWKINGQRIGCCTDDRSVPLTLCIDSHGFETETPTTEI
tara:strand:+ start:305 stop:589 length:285 start_codon:yes stop_codon:yes gene_type:complete